MDGGERSARAQHHHRRWHSLHPHGRTTFHAESGSESGETEAKPSAEALRRRRRGQDGGQSCDTIPKGRDLIPRSYENSGDEDEVLRPGCVDSPSPSGEERAALSPLPPDDAHNMDVYLVRCLFGGGSDTSGPIPVPETTSAYAEDEGGEGGGGRLHRRWLSIYPHGRVDDGAPAGDDGSAGQASPVRSCRDGSDNASNLASIRCGSFVDLGIVSDSSSSEGSRRCGSGVGEHFLPRFFETAAEAEEEGCDLFGISGTRTSSAPDLLAELSDESEDPRSLGSSLPTVFVDAADDSAKGIPSPSDASNGGRTGHHRRWHSINRHGRVTATPTLDPKAPDGLLRGAAEGEASRPGEDGDKYSKNGGENDKRQSSMKSTRAAMHRRWASLEKERQQQLRLRQKAQMQVATVNGSSPSHQRGRAIAAKTKVESDAAAVTVPLEDPELDGGTLGQWKDEMGGATRVVRPTRHRRYHSLMREKGIPPSSSSEGPATGGTHLNQNSPGVRLYYSLMSEQLSSEKSPSNNGSDCKRLGVMSLMSSELTPSRGAAHGIGNGRRQRSTSAAEEFYKSLLSSPWLSHGHMRRCRSLPSISTTSSSATMEKSLRGPSSSNYVPPEAKLSPPFTSDTTFPSSSFPTVAVRFARQGLSHSSPPSLSLDHAQNRRMSATKLPPLECAPLTIPEKHVLLDYQHGGKDEGGDDVSAERCGDGALAVIPHPPKALGLQMEMMGVADSSSPTSVAAPLPAELPPSTPAARSGVLRRSTSPALRRWHSLQKRNGEMCQEEDGAEEGVGDTDVQSPQMPLPSPGKTQ